LCFLRRGGTKQKHCEKNGESEDAGERDGVPHRDDDGQRERQERKRHARRSRQLPPPLDSGQAQEKAHVH
jgi:hypothetical protein